jgi:hypothetical protein
VRRIIIPPLLVALAGCGQSAPPPEQQVRDTLHTFATAVEKRDYQSLCDKVFAPKLLQGLESIGLPCEIAMQKSFDNVKDPKLTIGSVTVTGAKASAQIKTSATGQSPSTDTIELSRIKGRWRVSALGSAPQPTPTPTQTEAP